MCFKSTFLPIFFPTAVLPEGDRPYGFCVRGTTGSSIASLCFGPRLAVVVSLLVGSLSPAIPVIWELPA